MNHQRTESPVVIHWFRNDLRLSDNPALHQASMAGHVLPVYILDKKNADEYPVGAASRCWLHYSLQSLNLSLSGQMIICQDDSLTALNKLITIYGVQAIYWNQCYEPRQIQQDSLIKQHMQSKGIAVHISNGSLLWEPCKIKKQDGTPYKVFTPFYRKGCLQGCPPRKPLPKPQDLRLCNNLTSEPGIDALKLLPAAQWHKQLMSHWHTGEQAAYQTLLQFLEKKINHYKKDRDFPAKNATSRLSPHLHFGEISPNQIWYNVHTCADTQDVDHFCSELGWREFSHNLLYYNPQLPHKNLQSRFDHFPWKQNLEKLQAWQTGNTGIPMVDAGMRELWQTGYMHNRVRMITGSFLVKNLLLNWREGEQWFRDCLVDADLANNSASWQWIAGCGTDAAPYFRIFNPVTQSQKFDPEGDYIRRFVPELSALPNKYLFNPWMTPEKILKQAGIHIGTDYPQPIVDLKHSRENALKAFQTLPKKTL